ncbi:MAG: DUF4189 domain-containing protein [Terricaulis sp.]
MKSFLAAFALLLCLPASAYAAGALALQGGQCHANTHYGFVLGYASQADADQAALRFCGPGCSISLRSTVPNEDGYILPGHCVAFSRDESPGSNICGWNPRDAATEDEARQSAMQECERNGGHRCEVRGSGCDQ